MKNFPFVVGLVLLTVSMLVGWATGSSKAVPFDARAEAVELSALHKDPAAFVGRTLRIRFQVQGELAQWNPYLTRFGTRDYRAWRAWSEDQFLWEPDAWASPMATMFARRGSAVEAACAKLPLFARCEATVRVRQVFANQPWLEIESVDHVGGDIGEGSILHATRALRWIDEQRWSAALADFERALIGPMPDAARVELRRLRDETQAVLRPPPPVLK